MKLGTRKLYSRRIFLRKISSTGLGIVTLSKISCFKSMSLLKSPNIIVLFVDDLGWADINFRIPKKLMPNINQLSQESMVFSNAYSASPTCSPSRASVVTGKHPARLQIVRHIPNTRSEFHVHPRDPVQMPSRNWLPTDVGTYANAIKPFGYKSIFIGKWHLGPEKNFPVYCGFDVQKCVTEFGHPRSYYPPYFRDHHKEFENVPEDKYLTDRLTDDAVDYIKNHDDMNPFQLSLFYYGVHSPFIGRKDLIKKIEMSNPEFTDKELHHAAMVAAIDESIGRIRKALKQKSLHDNTMILFVGDQGGPFNNEPFRGGKPAGLALYEGGARIPFFVHWQNKIKQGVNEELVLTTDIYPTILEAAGGKITNDVVLDGESLIPILTSNKKLNRKEVFLYRSYEDQYACVRHGDWKLIAYRSGKMELYNLNEDISEKNDLSDQKPKVVNSLQSKLFAWEKKMGVEKISGCQ